MSKTGNLEKRLVDLNIEIEKLTPPLRRLQGEKRTLERELEQEKNKKYIGRTFKYRNSIGGGESWWLYRRVIGVHENYIAVDSYQRLPWGPEVKREDVPANLIWEWAEITAKEFHKGIVPILKEVGLKINKRLINNGYHTWLYGNHKKQQTI